MEPIGFTATFMEFGSYVLFCFPACLDFYVFLWSMLSYNASIFVSKKYSHILVWNKVTGVTAIHHSIKFNFEATKSWQYGCVSRDIDRLDIVIKMWCSYW